MGKEKKVFLTFKDFIESSPKFSDLPSFGEPNYNKIMEELITNYITALTPGRKVKINKKKMKIVLNSINLAEISEGALLDSKFYVEYVYPAVMYFALASETVKKQGYSDYQLFSFMFNFGSILSNLYEMAYGESSDKKVKREIKKKKKENSDGE